MPSKVLFNFKLITQRDLEQTSTKMLIFFSKTNHKKDRMTFNS